MTRTELDAAGIRDAGLRASYQRCRELNARHGRTFFLATRLLAPAQRPAIHALYGFARWADDIVDEPPTGDDVDSAAARLDAVAQTMRDSFRGIHDDPILAALADTAARYGIEHSLFDDFLDSMRMDLTVTDYPDRAALDRYIHGSAAVIGLQVLPVLGTIGPRSEAAPYAAALGKAFQLTNFLRDVAEDLDRGRVYLPADELAAFGVDRARLQWCRTNRRTDSKVRSALAAQHAVARDWYRYADAGIALLHPVSRPCVATAAVLYSEILDRIEQSEFAVFTARATVSNARRTRVAGSALARALWARRGSRARALTPTGG
ncbi:phytoene/squalene synthase family protein [Nocardia coubleae]|uniref:Phytoene/squalene synthase family protein n=1 Tax=Nocardia coubleae TaxID=356147 RepID=A0A846VZX5_9NOCA|nr:phytoene/squalene synthase family protein [Nocardia coubleae]NKX85997.1 phytoene/squalene synthase family protein [Nocardia coubleae]